MPVELVYRPGVVVANLIGGKSSAAIPHYYDHTDYITQCSTIIIIIIIIADIMLFRVHTNKMLYSTHKRVAVMEIIIMIRVYA